MKLKITRPSFMEGDGEFIEFEVPQEKLDGVYRNMSETIFGDNSFDSKLIDRGVLVKKIEELYEARQNALSEIKRLKKRNGVLFSEGRDIADRLSTAEFNLRKLEDK